MFKFLKSHHKEIATSALAVATLATEAVAETAPSNAAPIEKTEQNIVNEKGLPTQEIDVQKKLNEMAADSVDKKLEDLIGSDSTFINKALKKKWLDNFDNDSARVARLFSIFYEMKTRQDEALKNLANKKTAEVGEDEEVSVRRKRSKIAVKDNERIFSEAQDELYAREAEEANAKLTTAEEKKQEEMVNAQADKESAQEIAKNKLEKARENLPNVLWDAFADESFMEALDISQDTFDNFFTYITRELKKINDSGRTASVSDLKKITGNAGNKFPGLGNIFSAANPEQLKTAVTIFGAAGYVK